jgi:hypothetical protein
MALFMNRFLQKDVMKRQAKRGRGRQALVLHSVFFPAKRAVSSSHFPSFSRDEVFLRSGACFPLPRSAGEGAPAGAGEGVVSAGAKRRKNLIAAGYTTLVFLVRLLVLTLSLPLFLTAACVGLIDGLVRRDVRRFGAGRESGFVYHRAKAALMPLATLPWVIYLALPFSLNPLWILLPGAAALGAATCVAAATFKKYISLESTRRLRRRSVQQGLDDFP